MYWCRTSTSAKWPQRFARKPKRSRSAIQLAENRIILTRDTQIKKRRVAVNGELKVILIESDQLKEQLKQLIHTLKLSKEDFQPFTICLECNAPLAESSEEEVKDRVPPFVFKTQQHYVECPVCHRVYWKGTHWKAMVKKIENLEKC